MVKDSRVVEDLVNFHCYFPGGGRRPEEWSGQEYPSNWESLISDIDSLTREEGLDLDYIIAERNLMFQLGRKAISAAGSGRWNDVRRFASESQEHSQRMNEAITPIYEKLLERGYDSEELTR